MFTGRSKGNSSDNLAALQTQRRPDKVAPSIISNDLAIVGRLTSTGDIQIDGRVDGDIHAGSATVGEKGNVEGEIVAEEVAIHGKVQGAIRARKVFLAGTSHVEGTILHEEFSIEVGAFFEGNCRHSADPLSEVAAKPEPQPARLEPVHDLGVASRVSRRSAGSLAAE